MAKRTYVYAVSWGRLFRFSQRNWRNYCKVSALQDADPAHYGTLVAAVRDVTSWTQDEFREAAR